MRCRVSESACRKSVRPLDMLPDPGALEVITGTASALNRTKEAIRAFSFSECTVMRARA